ncbi:MAG TPA: GIY-YIG nuclease family protein [Ktedonobacteraceae bacterium]|nr:GIY-YIG nuclease family protein [Ktedonobacteraceae bacterium]
MDRRKEIINAYKRRKLRGGVYIIANTLNGKYLISYAANLKSVQNHFQFALTTGSTLHPRLRKDWEELGAAAFTLAVLEELEQKPEQSQAEFMADLKTLEQLVRANLDASKEY